MAGVLISPPAIIDRAGRWWVHWELPNPPTALLMFSVIMPAGNPSIGIPFLGGSQFRPPGGSYESHDRDRGEDGHGTGRLTESSQP